EDGQQHERDEEIDPERNPLDRVRHVTLESPPDERLDQLMHAEHDRESGKEKVIVTSAEMPKGVDADRGDDNPADKISLRREAHGEPYRKPVAALEPHRPFRARVGVSISNFGPGTSLVE